MTRYEELTEHVREKVYCIIRCANLHKKGFRVPDSFCITTRFIDGVTVYDVGIGVKCISYNRIHALSHSYFVIDIYTGAQGQLHVRFREYRNAQEQWETDTPPKQ
jgi:hypothetical protein